MFFDYAVLCVSAREMDVFIWNIFMPMTVNGKTEKMLELKDITKGYGSPDMPGYVPVLKSLSMELGTQS